MNTNKPFTSQEKWKCQKESANSIPRSTTPSTKTTCSFPPTWWKQTNPPLFLEATNSNQISDFEYKAELQRSNATKKSNFALKQQNQLERCSRLHKWKLIHMNGERKAKDVECTHQRKEKVGRIDGLKSILLQLTIFVTVMCDLGRSCSCAVGFWSHARHLIFCFYSCWSRLFSWVAQFSCLKILPIFRGLIGQQFVCLFVLKFLMNKGNKQQERDG